MDDVRRTVGLLGILLLAGCGGVELAPTPNLFVGLSENPFAGVPPALQSNEVELYYLTATSLRGAMRRAETSRYTRPATSAATTRIPISTRPRR